MSKIVADSIEDSGGLNPVPTLALGFGINQTWQDVSGSRSMATIYTNTTNKTIVVRIASTGTVGSGADGFVLDLDGSIDFTAVVTDPITTDGGAILYVHIPPGSTYQVDFTNNTITYQWLELRDTP